MPRYQKLHVILSRDHFGSKPGRDDRGAEYDINGDGSISFDEREANLTPYIIDGCKTFLEAHGATVDVYDVGQYRTRHGSANRWAAHNTEMLVVYVAQHLNRFRKNAASYSSGFYDQRSTLGQKLAMNIAGAYEEAALPGVSRVIYRGAAPGGDWANAYYTIKGIYSGPANICGYCSEPLFMDHQAHRQHLTPAGLRRIGEIQAKGILSFYNGM